MSPPHDDEPPSDDPDGPVDGERGSDEAGGSPPRESGSDAESGGETGANGATELDVGRGDPDEDAVDDTGVAANGAGAPVDGTPVHRQDADGDGATGEGSLRTFAVDVVSSALAVLLVGALLFAVSGVWPPMVAIESPSMTPHMETGDLVFVMEEGRFPGDGAVAGTGVVTLRSGQETGYEKFQRPGDVIVYKPDGSESATPIIHRAMFYVEEGENWYERADRQSIGRYSECGETTEEALPTCPAPHAGFITKGDANGGYDQAQANPLSGPVKPEWVVGTAEVRVPKLGCIRLRSERCAPGLRAATTGAGLTADAAVTAEAGNRTAVAP